MHKMTMIALLVACSAILHAQVPGFTPVQDLAKFKEAFGAASQKTNSIKSDFVQEKNLSMLSEKIVSKGKFWFKKSNMVRMEYTQPFQYLMIINNNNVFVKDGQKENKISTGSNKLFQQINRIMVDCVQGTALNNNNFKVSVFENGQFFLVELVPSAKALAEYFRNIHLFIGKKDYSVMKIEMHELSGDYTSINFINKELNVTIPDALFAIN
jgi:outer membrane lipoprotein-sorting protein